MGFVFEPPHTPPPLTQTHTHTHTHTYNNSLSLVFKFFHSLSLFISLSLSLIHTHTHNIHTYTCQPYSHVSAKSALAHHSTESTQALLPSSLLQAAPTHSGGLIQSRRPSFPVSHPTDQWLAPCPVSHIKGVWRACGSSLRMQHARQGQVWD